jgi:hypothetical protein
MSSPFACTQTDLALHGKRSIKKEMTIRFAQDQFIIDLPTWKAAEFTVDNKKARNHVGYGLIGSQTVCLVGDASFELATPAV